VIRINGTVAHHQNGSGLSGVRVEAWDEQQMCRDLIARVITDETGGFDLRLPGDYLGEVFGERTPQLVFKVFRHGELLAQHPDAAIWRGERDRPISITIDPERQPHAAGRPSPSVVRGQLHTPDGLPVAGKMIRAFDAGVRSETELGTATTSSRGSFQIHYDRAAPAKHHIDLVVRAYDGDTEIATSAAIHHAPAIARVALVTTRAFRPRPELDRLVDQVAPVLGALDLADLGPTDVRFVAASAGVDPAVLAQLATAHRLARASGVPAPALFALLREGFTANLDSLAAQSASTLREALARAAAAGIAEVADVDAVVARLAAVRRQRIVAPIAPIVDAVAPPAELRARFVELYTASGGTASPELWQQLRANTGSPAVDDLELAYEASTLADGDLAVVTSIVALRRRGTIRMASDLARLAPRDWSPDPQRGRALAEAAALRFPSVALVHRLTSQPSGDRRLLAQVLAANPSLDFEAQTVDDYLAAHPDALGQVTAGDRAAVTAQLKAVSRLFKLSPRAAEVEALLDAGLRSAHDIASLGRDTFVMRTEEIFGSEDAASSAFDRATQVAGVAATIFARVSGAFDTISLRPLPALGDALPPTWKNLFGNPELCACEHCRSVLGPAAYLVDLLHFLKDSGKHPVGSRPIDHLIARRPDLVEIELSCANTNTVLPYIDLVNELLEHEVAPGSPPGAIVHDDWQTRGIAAELAAEPEHTVEAAYATLAAAVYPWQLPFDRWLEEVRTYLSQLGVTREAALATLRPDARARAIEHLGAGPAEAALIAGELAGHTVSELWGFPPAATSAWIDSLRPVRELMRRSGLHFEELLGLLAVPAINPGGAIALDSDSCNLDEVKLVGLDETRLHRLSCWVRLWRRLGWPVHDLDRAARALATSAASFPLVATLEQLADVQRLRERLGLGLPDVLAWWTPKLETADYVSPSGDRVRSLYSQIFLDRKVLAPDDHTFDLVADGSALASAPLLSDHLGHIARALRLDGASLHALTDELVKTGALVTLELLTSLFRQASLARALALPATDIATLIAITQIDPFASPADSVRFVDEAQRISDSPLTLGDLDYLLRSGPAAASDVAIDDETLRQAADDLESGLSRIAADNAFAPDPDGVLCRARLGMLLSTDELPRAMALLGDSTPRSAARTAVEKPLIASWFGAFLDAADAQAKLTGPTPLDQPKARYEYVLAAADAYLARTQSEALVATTVASLTGTTRDVALELVTARIHSRITASRPIATDLITGDTPTRTGALRLVARISAIVTALGLTDQLRDVFDNAAVLDWYDLDKLPAIATALASGEYARWRRLVTVGELKSPGVVAAMRGAHDGASLEATLALISTATGWSLPQLHEITSALALDAKALAAPETIRRQGDAVALADKTGLAPHDLFALTSDALTAKDAAAVRAAVKARHDRGRWSAVMQPLRDVLRQKQRDALVAYRVASLGLSGSDRLFERLLIDVEMCACQLTSRIKQAISAVQLFIQRAFLGQEPGVTFSGDEARAWEWQQNYRVWEANRKVFLWPENWIEPSLRGGKSPFFRDFENDLLQNEVTSEVAEAAFERYLIQLDTVANLDICALYTEDRATEDEDVLHVLGRTRDQPRLYYYRRREHLAWTPWERVDADIEGDHVMLVIYERRLRIVWPIVSDQTRPAAKGGGEGPHYMRVQLAWSEYRDGGWSAKQVTSSIQNLDFLIDEVKYDGGPVIGGKVALREELMFKTFIAGDAFDVRTYVQSTRASNGGAEPAADSSLLSIADYVADSCGSSLESSEETDLEARHIVDPPRRVTHRYNTFVEDPVAPGDELHLTGTFATGTPYDVTVLSTTPGRFQLVPPHQEEQFQSQLRRPFVFQDRARAFVVYPHTPPPHVSHVEIDDTNVPKIYRFEAFSHPYACTFIKQLRFHGVRGVLAPDPKDPETAPLVRQRASYPAMFSDLYAPVNLGSDRWMVEKPFPVDSIDFDHGASQAAYNWEIFFHIPMLVARQLLQNNRFEDARRWMHFVFDPTATSGGPSPGRYWQVAPFHTNADAKLAIDELLALLDYKGKDATSIRRHNELRAQIAEWTQHPFDPHLIARMRPEAYQRWVVMSYLDNLIAWGDELFRRDTIEAINEATQIYCLAAAILGDRPEDIPERASVPRTFRELMGSLDAFSNATLIEDLLPFPGGWKAAPVSAKPGGDLAYNGVLRLTRSQYFCVPRNEKLLGYWDTLADRLFKIRHCMNLDGVVRQLPLFEPPIDPALLVRATAAGLSIASVLDSLYDSPLPAYRFSFLIQRAADLCAAVSELGSKLLAALERRDAEQLALLHDSNELRLLEIARDVKRQQIDEARKSYEALTHARAMAAARLEYYQSVPLANDWEVGYVEATIAAAGLLAVSQGLEVGAVIAHNVPDATTGQNNTVTYGGHHMGMSLEAAGRSIALLATATSTGANLSQFMGTLHRRQDEVAMQAQVATEELAQIDRQLLAAQIKIDIATNERVQHDAQIENNKAETSMMRRKFSNAALYDWMVAQLSAVHFQAYQQAYAMARGVERAYSFELARFDDDAYIRPDAWDSLKKGLLAGERLSYDLRRLEAAYLDHHRRELEITKHVSLAMLEPDALVRLRTTGECFFALDEGLFDLDFPGHYLRRLASVSVTIPCVSGPYTGVNATLTLLENSFRKDATLGAGKKYDRDDEEDGRFVDSVAGVQSIVTSSGRDDAGTFEGSARDDRYLPFEGAGAISSWRLQLPIDANAFDLGTVGDVVLHLRYTARDGGDVLRTAARDSLAKKAPRTGHRLFSARHELPLQWTQLFSPVAGGTPTLRLPLMADRFPYRARVKTFRVDEIEVFLIPTEATADAWAASKLGIQLLQPDGAVAATGTMSLDDTKLVHASLPVSSVGKGLVEWRLVLDPVTLKKLAPALVDTSASGVPRIHPAALADVLLIVHYATTQKPIS
jgi:hypothetical protein